MKRTIGMLLSVVMLFSCSMAAYAISPEENSEKAGFDTLSISMEEYLEKTKPTKTLLRTTLEDDTIEKTTQ